jgi:hypothetical protein
MESSSEDEGPYTATNVTLGFAVTESTGDEISHLGGHSVRVSLFRQMLMLTRLGLA